MASFKGDYLLRHSVHDFCLERGLALARADRQIPSYDDSYFRDFLVALQKGSYFADFGSMRSFSKASFRSHYLRPQSHRGYLPGIRNAGQTCERFFYLAQLHWFGGSYDKSAVFLGAAAHLIQDLCNPFHTTHRNLRQHTEYERQMPPIDPFALSEGGIYNFDRLEGHYHDDGAFGWIDYAAHKSAPNLPVVVAGYSHPRAEEVLAEIMMNGQRLTAGFVSFFFSTIRSCKEPMMERGVAENHRPARRSSLVTAP